MPGPKRRGVSGWPGPKSYVVERGPNTSSTRGTIPAMERIYTTPLLDKLGIRPGMRVAIIDVDDPDIRASIRERTTELTEGWPEPDTDVVLLGADDLPALQPLEALACRIRPAGAIWVVSRKGPARTIRDVEVIEAARSAGLVDNKIASFSTTHTAMRLVIPVDRRPR